VSVATGQGEAVGEDGTALAGVDLSTLDTVPDFDKDQTLSLIFEMLYRNSLWPGEPVQ
jgi:hypothetical protein